MNNTVKSVQISFSGSGDSGCIDDVAFYDAAGTQISYEVVKESALGDINMNTVLDRAMSELGCSGWEIDSGSNGLLAFNISANNDGAFRLDLDVSESEVIYFEEESESVGLTQSESTIEEIEGWSYGEKTYEFEIAGSGDSGSINDMCELANGERVAIDEDTPQALVKTLNQIPFQWLESELPGWEIDAGSEAKLTVSINANGEVRCDTENSYINSFSDSSEHQSLSAVSFQISGDEITVVEPTAAGAEKDPMLPATGADQSPSM
jgi:hypothetical protein